MPLGLLMPDLGGDGHDALDERSRRPRDKVTHSTTALRPSVRLDHVAHPRLTRLAAWTVTRGRLVVGRVRRVDGVIADTIGQLASVPDSRAPRPVTIGPGESAPVLI